MMLLVLTPIPVATTQKQSRYKACSGAFSKSNLQESMLSWIDREINVQTNAFTCSIFICTFQSPDRVQSVPIKQSYFEGHQKSGME